MAEITYTTTFKFKRGKSSAWTSVNPILAQAEPGYELDTGRLKIGDGVTAWRDLEYFSGSATASEDGKSLTIASDGKLELSGFADATANQIPSKGTNGNIVWIDQDVPLTEEQILSVTN